MAHDKNPLEGIAGQYVRGWAKDKAVWLLSQAWFLRAIAFFSVNGKSVAHGLKILSGAGHLGGSGWFAHWFNFFTDELAAEVAERLDEDPDLIVKMLDELPATEEEAIGVFLEGLKSVNDQEAFLVGGILHKDMECLQVQEFVAANPPRQRKGKGGVVITEPNRQVVPTTFLRGLEGKKPLCPSCYQGGKIEFGAAKPKAQTKTLFELIREVEADLQPDDEDEIAPALLTKVCAFSDAFHGLQPELKSKFIRLAAMPNAKERLLIVLNEDDEHWESVLDTMLDPKEDLANSVSQKVMDLINRLIRRFADEGIEQDELFEGMGTWLQSLIDRTRNSRVSEKQRRVDDAGVDIALTEDALNETGPHRFIKRWRLKSRLKDQKRELARHERRLDREGRP